MTSLQALRDLLEKATPGPWGVYQATPHEPVQVNHPTGDICEMDTWTHRPDEREPDAALIAALRNSADVLLDVVEAAVAYTSGGPGTTEGRYRDLVAALAKLEEWK